MVARSLNYSSDLKSLVLRERSLVFRHFDFSDSAAHVSLEPSWMMDKVQIKGTIEKYFALRYIEVALFGRDEVLSLILAELK